MLEFKKLTIEDKKWVEPLLALSDYRGCEYNFTNNYVWQDIYEITAARYQDFYITLHKSGFVFPAGKGDTAKMLSELKAYSKAHNIPFRFTSMDKSAKEYLENNFPGKFSFDTNPDLYDYVYLSESLATLSGKKLHSKRNYINRFKLLDYTYEDITPDNIQQCFDMSREWCKRNMCEQDDEKAEEMCAVNKGLEHFFELGLCGILLKVEDKVQAFCYGEKQSSDTYVTHVEKAFTDYDGAYPMINYLFANKIKNDCLYINREEDMGEENLRKAKRSYKPIMMVEKYSAEYTGD